MASAVVLKKDAHLASNAKMEIASQLNFLQCCLPLLETVELSLVETDGNVCMENASLQLGSAALHLSVKALKSALRESVLIDVLL